MSIDAWSAMAMIDPLTAEKMFDCIKGAPDGQSKAINSNTKVLIKDALAEFAKLNPSLANLPDLGRSQTFQELWFAAQQALTLIGNPAFSDRKTPAHFLVNNCLDWMIAFFAGIDPHFSKEMVANAEPDQWIRHGLFLDAADKIAIIDLFGIPDAEARLIEFCSSNNSPILALNYSNHAVSENNIQRCIRRFANLRVIQMISDTRLSDLPSNITSLSTLIEYCFTRELERAKSLNDMLLHLIGKSAISNVLISEHRGPGTLGLLSILSSRAPNQIDVIAHGGWPIQTNHRTAILLSNEIFTPTVRQHYIPWHGFDDGNLPETTSMKMGKPSLPDRLNVHGNSSIKHQIKTLLQKFSDILRPTIKKTRYKVGLLLTSYNIDNKQFIQCVSNIAAGLERHVDIEIEFRGREVESAKLFILYIMNQSGKNSDDIFRRVKFHVVGQRSLRKFFSECDLIVDFGYPTSAVLFAFQAKKPVVRLLQGEHCLAGLLAQNFVPSVNLNDPVGYFFELLERPDQRQFVTDQQQDWFREAMGGSKST